MACSKAFAGSLVSAGCRADRAIFATRHYSRQASNCLSTRHTYHRRSRTTCAPFRSSSEQATSFPLDADEARQLREAALQEFRDIVLTDDETLPILQCATLIARHRYPDLKHEEVEGLIASLADEVKVKLGGIQYPMKIISTINDVLYQGHGFKGNQDNYYDPDNSCINRVLDTKRGIPITLSLVYMEVSRLIGLPMVGLNFPCHLMIRPNVDEVEVMVDAFNAGEVCYLQDAEQLLSKLMGAQIMIDPAFLEKGRHISDRLFLLRMLNNLKQIYMLTQEFESGLWIVRYMRALDPGNVEHVRDEGMCLYYLGSYVEASSALQLYVKLSPKAFDLRKVQAMLLHVDKLRLQQAAAKAGGQEDAASS